MLRSALAVFAGLTVMVAMVFVMTVFSASFSRDATTEEGASSLLRRVAGFLSNAGASLAGGYVTGRVASHDPAGHGAVLAIIMTLMAVSSARREGLVPTRWYHWAAPIFIAVLAFVGARLSGG